MVARSDKRQDQEAAWSLSLNVDLASRTPSFQLGLAVQKWKDSL